MNESSRECSLLNNLIAQHVDAIFIIDSDLSVISWNEKCEKLLNTTRAVALGKPINEVVPEFSGDYFRALTAHALSVKATIAERPFSLIRHNQRRYLEPAFSPVQLTDSGVTLCMVNLRETEVGAVISKFKPLIEESPIATAIYRPDGTPKYLNKAYGKLWGGAIAMADHVIRNYNIFEDEQLEELGIMPLVQKGFSGETVEIPSIAYMPAQTDSIRGLGLKERKYVKGYIFSIKNEFGNIEEVVTVLSDVTFQKQAEEILTDTHLKFQMLTMGLPGVIYEFEDNFNEESVFRYISQGCNEMFGFSPEEIMEDATLLDAVIHPDDLESFKLSSMVSKENREEWQWEGRIVVEGKVKWIEGKSSPSKDKNGKLIRHGMLLDITEKKEVEKQYQLSEERLQTSQLLIQRNEQLFRQLFENAPLGIVLLNEKHRVVKINQGFRDIFGFSGKEIIGNQLNSVLVPDDLREEAININKLTASGKVSIKESSRKHKDGHYIPVIIYGVPVMFDNQVIGVYGIYVDITDRTKAENELQIRNSELDNFVYKVSHDLRAPLSSILGLVNLAHHKENKDDLLLYMGLIESRVKQLDHFINDVLSHSKNLKLAVTIDPVNLHEIIESCFMELSYLHGADRMIREVNIATKVFYSDKWRINEVFRNLISNAIKYVNPRVEHPFIKIDIEITDESAVIIFSDNGIGIEKKTLPKVFEMFYRATEYSEGSGIGLYIVKNAIKKLGGKIRIESKPNVGTNFRIMLPNRKEAYFKRKNEK